MSVRIEDWGGELPDSTPLWRYMKLSTFLLLLEGKAFFPSVQILQKGDPLEGVLSMDPDWWAYAISCSDDRGVTLHSWLDKLAECKKPENRNLPEEFYECLRRRRAVWCWHEAENESAAMWSIYANAGIAVKTDVASLREALPARHEFQIARVKYLRRNPPPVSTFQWDPTDELDGLKLVIRPHLIKGEEYAHEREVRVSAFCLSQESGWHVEGIESRDLIKEVVVSPLVRHDEYVALKEHLKAFAEKWRKKPAIRYSALLGHLPDEEERAALARRYFPDHKESDLPWPLNDL